MRNGAGVDVDPGHRTCHARQQRAAITFAARHIEHTLAHDIAARKRVAMPVLMRDLAGNAGDESLAGEFEVGWHRLIEAASAPPTPHGRAPPIHNFSRSATTA